MLFSFFNLSKFSLTLSAYDIDLPEIVCDPLTAAALGFFEFLLKLIDIFE